MERIRNFHYYFFLLLTFSCPFHYAKGSRMDKMVMKINDIESRLMSEIKERREQTKNINARFDIVEEALNAKKVLETTTGLGSTLKETIQSLQMQLEEIKENANDVDIAETLKAVEVLKKGFQDEKKESYKLRIRVAQLQEMVKSLAGETGNDAPAVTSTDKQYDTESTRPKSCLELQQLGYTSSGLYTVHVKDNNSKRAIQVYCDQETDSGGWTVFQRRQDGSVDFYRTWQEYKAGFGDPHGEFWLGNDNIILLLSHHCCHELRIELQDFDNNTRYAKYGNFSIGPESTNYTLTAEECVADTSVSFGYYHSGYQFSTRDRDNDVYEPLHCAQSFKGGWWYRSCINANLNGLYLGGEYKPTGSQNGVVWQWWRGRNYSLKFMEMKWREKV